MHKNTIETAIQVYARPVPAVVEACEPLTAASWTMVYPDLMTEAEVIDYLRIPHVSSASNYRYVMDHLIRMRDLPCIHISRKRLYPLESVKAWVLAQVGKEAA